MKNLWTWLVSIALGVGLVFWAKSFSGLAAVVLGLLGLAALAFVFSRVLLDRAAASIVAQVQGPLSTPHVYRPATLAQQPHLDALAYQRASEELVSAGFRVVGDVVNVTLAELNPQLRTVVRWLVREADGTVADVYELDTSVQAKTSPGLPPRCLFVTLRTELEGDVLLATANLAELRLLKAPDTFDALALPVATPPRELLRAHDERLGARAAGGHRPLGRVRTFDDVAAHQDRVRRLELAYRQARGWLTEPDLLHLAGPGAEQTARAVWPYVKGRLERQAHTTPR